MKTAQNPFVILWRVMDACNLSCPFCAYDKRLDFQRSSVDPREVARVIDLLATWRPQGRPVVLSWLGGEPTLWPDFPEMVDRARSAGLIQSVTTNGTTLGSPKLRARLVENFKDITISVDALGKTHEDLRGWPGGFAKLATWVPQLAKAGGAGLNLRANVVLMRQTLEDFEQLCLTLARWGIKTITFNQLGGRDRPEYFPAHRLRPRDVEALQTRIADLRSRLAKDGVRLLGGADYVARIEESSRDGCLPIKNCQVAQDFLFIDEACRIAPCAFVGGHFGLRTQDLCRVNDLDRLASNLCQMQQVTPHAACDNCMSTQQFSKFAA